MKIALIVEPSNATSIAAYYRWSGVLGPLSRSNPEVTLITSNSWNWTDLMLCDISFFGLPRSDGMLEAVKLCKRMGIPVVVDYDDNLFQIPPWFPGGQTDDAAKITIKECLSRADLVTVSTDALLKVMAPNGKGIVLPNAWNGQAFKVAPINQTRKVISWRGGWSHAEDFRMYQPAVWNVAKRHPSLEWWFFGVSPWSISQIPLNFMAMKWTDFFSYMHSFLNLKPYIHIVPVVPHPFNDSKSNIAWIEATQAGAMVVAPDFEEFRKPGVFNYSVGPDAVEDFESKLEGALNCSQSEAHQRVQAGRDFITEHLTLKTVNQQRYDAFKSLVN